MPLYQRSVKTQVNDHGHKAISNVPSSNTCRTIFGVNVLLAYGYSSKMNMLKDSTATSPKKKYQFNVYIVITSCIAVIEHSTKKLSSEQIYQHPAILTSLNHSYLVWGPQIDSLVQERRNSSALAMGLRLSCTKPSRCNLWPPDPPKSRSDS